MSIIPLDEFDTAVPPVDPTDPDRFRIEVDAQAEWALRKLRSIRAKKQENVALAEAERERITAWLEQANAALDPDENYFVGLLSEYLRRERDENGRKSIELPHGVIKSRSVAAKARVLDEDLFVKWAAENADTLVVYSVKPSQSAINKAVTVTDDGHAVYAETGELVPGVTIDPGRITFTVETN